MRWHVISAVFSRNVKQYFSGVLGYLFIVVFVMVCAILTFSAQFFADNLSNLDQLSKGFPALLLVFIPAITMNVWADEKRQGTDAILFTLPATDFEIMLGKYLAVAAVYTIALLFSATQLVALSFIGQPDWGVVISTYIGYWLAGLTLISIGMFASSMTSIVSVAFVVGALLCAIPVYIGNFFVNTPRFFGQFFRTQVATGEDGVELAAVSAPGYMGLEQFGLDWNLQDFTIGLIPLSNVLYFVSIIAFMLYLNLVVISKRHWSRGQQASLAGQFAIRIVSLAIALIAINFMVGRLSSSLMARVDMTAGRLYTLDETTLATLKSAREEGRPVEIQAFVSRDVPRSYASTKKQFTGLLRQFQYFGGSNVDVRFVDVLPNSNEETQAKRLGIEPRADRSEVGGRVVEQDVYLGARVSSTQDDAVLPFVDSDSSIEYQLTHSIATTTDADRKITLGIVDTDTFFGGPEIEGRRVPWAYNETLSYLKTQFRIKNIPQDDLQAYVASEPAEGEEAEEPRTAPDVLLVADPSSLSEPNTGDLVKYMQAGNPVVFLADPLPFYWTSRNPLNIGVLNAPKQPRLSQRSPYTQVLSSTFAPKADNGTCSQILNALGIEWNNGRVAWSLFDPHPNFKGAWIDQTGQATWPEYFGPYENAFVFVKNRGDHKAFNAESSVSGGLKELLFFYPGSVRQSSDSKLSFTPLVTLSKKSGTTDWEQLTEVPTQMSQSFDPRTGRITRNEQKRPSQITGEDLRVLNPAPAAYIDDAEHVLAAHIKGDADGSVNAIIIADMDFVSELYFEQIAEDGLGQKLDHVAFLQNAIEVLAGEEAFVALRNRRPAPRTLVYIEKETEKYREDRAKTQEAIEKKIRDQLETEQGKLDEEAAKIEGDQSLSFFEKLQRTSQEASDAQRRFSLKKERLDRDLKIQIDQLRSEEQNNIRRTEGFVKMLAIAFAPLPAFLLGCLVFMYRSTNERIQIKASRRVK